MSKIQRCRGQSCHLSQEEVIITLPPRGGRCLRFSFTQDPAPVPAATGQTSFSGPEQCPTKCLANPHNPLYSLRTGRMGPRSGPRCSCVLVDVYVCVCVCVCVLGQGVNFKPRVLQARRVIISLTVIKSSFVCVCAGTWTCWCVCVRVLAWVRGCRL